MRRRDFIKHCMRFITVISTLGFSNVNAKTYSGNVRQAGVFSAFIDTLIPEDSSPSASQLNMDRKLIAHAGNIKNYLKLIQLGCQWLDAQSKASYGKTFMSLKSTQKEAVVQLAENNPTESVSKMFFDRVRADLFRFYYSDPSTWEELGFTRAPQPIGYPEYTKSPHISPPHG